MFFQKILLRQKHRCYRGQHRLKFHPYEGRCALGCGKVCFFAFPGTDDLFLRNLQRAVLLLFRGKSPRPKLNLGNTFVDRSKPGGVSKRVVLKNTGGGLRPHSVVSRRWESCALCAFCPSFSPAVLGGGEGILWFSV